MPLVEENRRLHDEVRALQRALAENSVRLDEALQSGAFQSKLVSWLGVTIDHSEMLSMERSDTPKLLAKKLASALVGHRFVQRVEGTTGELIFRVAFLKLPSP